MTEREELTVEDVEEWADKYDYSQEDIDNLAAIVQAGQLAINTLGTRGLTDESQDEAVEVYETLFEASSMDSDSDYEEPMNQYLPKMAMQDSVQDIRRRREE